MTRLLNFKLIFLSLLVLAGCTHTPTIYKESGIRSVRVQIQKAIQDSRISTNLGIKVVSLRTGKSLYELNSNSLFNPASNNKLYICVAALALLDTSNTFKTKVFQVNQNLYLVGDGDPDLSLENLDSLAEVLSHKALKIENLVLDDTKFDSIRFGQGWMWDEGPWWYAAQIGALTVNDNSVDFFVVPGSLGQPAQIKVNPNTQYIQLKNHSLTVNDTTDFIKFEIDRDWMNASNKFTISGYIMDTTSRDTVYRNIEDPTLFTGTVFKELLISYGTHVKNIRKDKLPDHAVLLAHHESNSLMYTLTNLMKKSDNLTAEILVKTIGNNATQRQGNWDNGLTAMKTFLQDIVKMDTTTLNLADGSGVSRYNYSSPAHFVQLLSWAYHQQTIRSNLLSTLSIGGWDGTLKDRMETHEVGRVHAKTGTLSGVSCLSGYVFTKSGEALAFSILMNGYVGSSVPYRNLQDRIVAILSNIN